MSRIQRIVGLATLLLVVITSQATAAIVLDSGADPFENATAIVGDYNWVFHRFEITTPTTIDTVGGYFRNDSGGDLSVFAAIVALTGSADNPDSLDLTTPDLLGSTLMNVGATMDHYETAFSLALDPGWYALEFGTGAFGAASVPDLLDLGMNRHLTDLEPTQLANVAIQTGHPTLAARFTALGMPVRFTVTGHTSAVPEPGSVQIWAFLAAAGLLYWRRKRMR